MRIIRTVALCILIVAAAAWPAAARHDWQTEPPERDPALEQAIYDRLSAINPEAVPVFQAATVALDARDLAAAKKGYEQVLALAPNFPDALRRLSYIEGYLGNVDAAVQLARRAYNLDTSPYNQSTLAHALLATEEARNRSEALTLARSAAAALPDDADINMILLLAGIANQNEDAIRQASAKLVQVQPENPLGHYFVGLIAAEDGKWERAERELLLSKKLGMDAEYVQEALNAGIARQARLYRGLRWGGYALAAWLVGLGLIFVIGVVLSRMTLKAVHRTQSTAHFEIGKGERLVRALYRIIIAVTSLYFYISIPFLILVVVAGTAGIFYLFLVAGRIPLRFAVMLGLAALYTLIAVVRSVFSRIQEGEPGRPLPRDEAPLLWSFVEEVAQRVGVRPVDAIYVTPAPEIAVTERGSLLRKLRGAGQRCLILGLGALPGMTQGQFKAILAHEYGHFSNRDTAGGNLARQVSVSIHRMAYGLATSGQAAWYNPVWLFINGFYRIFLRVTLGASRLQEILADRYAALAYGAQNFVDGLMYIVRQSLTFDAETGYKVNQTIQAGGTALPNLYTPTELPEQIQQDLEKKLEEELSRPTSPYDSHPSVKERIELVRALESPSTEISQEPAWELLSRPDELQNEMTRLVQRNVWQRRALRAGAS